MNVQFKDPSCSSLPVPTLIKSVCNYYRQEGNLRRAKKIGHGLGIFEVKLLEQNLLPEYKDASSGRHAEEGGGLKSQCPKCDAGNELSLVATST